MTGREMHFTEAHDHLHGPMFFKLLPPARFASPPANTALQVQQAKQILQAKKVLHAGIKSDEVGRQGGYGHSVRVKLPAAVISEQAERQLQQLSQDGRQPRLSNSDAPAKTADSAAQVSFGECRLQETVKGGQKGHLKGIQPNMQGHVEPLKGSTLALQKGEEVVPRCQSKDGPVEKKHILLSTGKFVSITVNPSKMNSMTSQSSKQSIQGLGEDAKKVAALEESLKYDNYYNLAAGGVCAVSTAKEAWEYQEEPGQRRLELSLGAQFNKLPKELEFYNSTTARGQEDKRGQGGKRGSEKSQSPRGHNQRDEVASSTVQGPSLPGSSHQLTPAVTSRDARTPSSAPRPVAGPQGSPTLGAVQRLRANESRVASTPTTTKTQTKGGVFVNVWQMDSLLLAESESSKPGENSGSESISKRPPVAGVLEGPSQTAQPGASFISNGSGVPSTLEAIVPKATAANSSSEITVNSTATTVYVQEPLNDLSAAAPSLTGSKAAATQEPLNDLSAADPTPASLTGHKAATTQELLNDLSAPDPTPASLTGRKAATTQELLNDLGAPDPTPTASTGSAAATTETVQVKCVTTVNQIEIKKDTEKGPDTWSDEMIAQLLQLHEDELTGRTQSSSHLRGAGGLGEAREMDTDGSGLSFEDYELARQMQEEFDEELALEMEEEQSQVRRYNSPYDERADRRNTPSTYSYYPTTTTPDNNAQSSFRNRTFGRRPRGRYQREEHRAREVREYEWYRGLGTVVASRTDPHDRLRGEMDMSYESLSQLQDVSQGLSMSTITRLTNVYKFVPKQADSGNSADKAKPEDAKCCICLQAFVEGQQLRSLPCIHAFHRYCIDKWLSENKHCPVCMKDVLEFAVKFVDRFSSSSSK